MARFPNESTSAYAVLLRGIRRFLVLDVAPNLFGATPEGALPKSLPRVSARSILLSEAALILRVSADRTMPLSNLGHVPVHAVGRPLPEKTIVNDVQVDTRQEGEFREGTNAASTFSSGPTSRESLSQTSWMSGVGPRLEEDWQREPPEGSTPSEIAETAAAKAEWDAAERVLAEYQTSH